MEMRTDGEAVARMHVRQAHRMLRKHGQGHEEEAQGRGGEDEKKGIERKKEREICRRGRGIKIKEKGERKEGQGKEGK